MAATFITSTLTESGKFSNTLNTRFRGLPKILDCKYRTTPLESQNPLEQKALQAFYIYKYNFPFPIDRMN